MAMRLNWAILFATVMVRMSKSANTDAEGRLVLADGLIDASAQHPQLIIDMATPTGAAKTALGNDHHALFSFDDTLAGRLPTSAAQENEPFWRLPLAEFHQIQLPLQSFCGTGTITGSAAYPAGASTAVGFLSHFAEKLPRRLAAH